MALITNFSWIPLAATGRGSYCHPTGHESLAESPASQHESRDQNQGNQLQTPRCNKERDPRDSHVAQGQAAWEEPYLEASSLDAPVEFIILSAPAPEAVGHPIALTQRQAVSVTCPSSQGCTLVSYCSGESSLSPASQAPPSSSCPDCSE